MAEVHTKSDAIIKNQVHQPTAQVQPLGYDQASMMHEIRDSLNTIKHNTGNVQKTSCPTCASSTIVIFIAVVQALLFIVYAIYK